MTWSRSNYFGFLILLAAALALGATHRAVACPQASSGAIHRPCCDGMNQAAMEQPGAQHSVDAHILCEMALGRLNGCTAAGHCACGQPVSAVQVTPRDDRPAILSPPPLPIWPGSPVAAGLTPPPQGPPETGFADPPGRHTYLATLRLRI